MRYLKFAGVLIAFLAVAVSAGAVIAALGDSETASGSITVSSESADLYICEPGNADGPECGADDSDGAEIVFEGDEQFIPGEGRYYDIRLKNVGNRDFVVTDYIFTVTEADDPGNNCPDGALHGGGNPNRPNDNNSVWILGKDGDPVNDNESVNANTREFRSENGNYSYLPIFIATGDYEDIRLRLQLDLFGTENCDGNIWDVSFQFVVN